MTPSSWPIATALRESLRGYGRGDLRADLMAGLTLGMLALPLAMALAIAVDVPPQHGLYTAIIAGALIALFGGSRFNVSGPTAAFIVLLIPIVHKFGLGGLLVTTLLTGVILIVMGFLRLGQLIQYIPYPVVLGFTSGIAVVIAFLQIKDLLGLTTPAMPEHFLDRLQVLLAALPTARWADVATGLFTLLVLIFWNRLGTPIPRQLAALVLAGLAAYGLQWLWPTFDPITLGDKFHWEMAGQSGAGIPPFAPQFVLPWTLPDASGQPVGLSWPLLRDLLVPALTLAMLAAIESLLCAVVADGMSRTRHDPNAELVGQGIGNLAAPFFGGITATAAIARTATNVRAGARSPLAAVFHALTILLAVVVFAPWLAHVPMATLAAILLLTAWNLSEAPHFMHMVKVAPRTDVAVLLTCFGLTIFIDMVAAVGVGMVLAAFIFMHQMAKLTGGRERGRGEPMPFELPDWAVFYEFNGPLFFGAAEQAFAALDRAAREHKEASVIIIDFTHVPTLDMSGIHALESALGRLHDRRIGVVLSGMHPAVYRPLRKAGLHDVPGRLAFATDATQTALAAAALRQAQREAE
ncbi:C4-dicarboxylic acid transporter DauA [Thiofaba sp. EF100]|uniref:C4-dicarboxylic acid transporter DauA n=1 Tax=Thiofaba sp. EF100 TaxID=3121274 RepID=UPI00322190F3